MLYYTVPRPETGSNEAFTHNIVAGKDTSLKIHADVDRLLTFTFNKIHQDSVYIP